MLFTVKLPMLNVFCLSQIARQIQVVNDVYKRHNLPEFYKVCLCRFFTIPYQMVHMFISSVLFPEQDFFFGMQDPRPHISLAWALGDISYSLKQVVEELKRYNVNFGSSNKSIFACKFSGIECKIGKKCYKICNVQDL